MITVFFCLPTAKCFLKYFSENRLLGPENSCKKHFLALIVHRRCFLLISIFTRNLFKVQVKLFLINLSLGYGTNFFPLSHFATFLYTLFGNLKTNRASCYYSYSKHLFRIFITFLSNCITFLFSYEILPHHTRFLFASFCAIQDLLSPFNTNISSQSNTCSYFYAD